MSCIKIAMILICLAPPAPPPAPPAGWLDCGFDALNIYRCKP
jgi:hypothetical protein